MRFLLGAEEHGEEHHDDHAPAANATIIRAAAAPATAAAPLHVEEDDGHGHGHGHGHGARGGSSNANLNLRIVALFVILVGSLLGALPPLLSARLRAPNTALSSALRAFAGGVILSLALIHITVHSVLELNEVEAYPYAGVLMLVGVTFMVISEHCLRMYYHPDPETPVDAHAHAVKAVDTAHDHAHDHEHGNDHHSHSLALSHCHPTGDSVSRVAAWMMELGCVFHSVIIGVDLGVTTDYNALTTLLIALVFHQFIEGISLGTVVAAAGFQRLKAYSMVFLYSITTPVGIAIGIAVASSYDPESRRAILTKGCLDAVSGGLLLYIAIVHLVCPEFCSSRKAPLRHRLVSYVAFALGASFMAVLAKWA